MISRTAEYALRAVVWLATTPQTPQTTRQVAEGTHVPRGYLSKVLQSLAERGIVNSQRGLGGGFVLARPPAELTVLAVINAVDPLERIERCPLNLKSHQTELCPLHRRLDDALALIERTFASCTIAELIDRPGAAGPLCAEPGAPVRVALTRGRRD